MKNTTQEKIIEIILEKLEGESLPENFDSGKSLLEQGIFDSLSFLEFMVDLESTFDVELDFSELDPSEFTSVENLAKLIDEKTKG